MRVLVAAAALWYFHMTGTCLGAMLVITIGYTVWDMYCATKRVAED